MNKYKYVFVVLVYKNTDVLNGFFDSIKHLDSYRVVVLDSFYDESTRDRCKKIAEENNSDFISIPNKGYGAGNNKGVEFVIANYMFDFLIISNSDIIVKTLQYVETFVDQELIIAPETIMLTGKKQNPSMVDFPGFMTIYYWLSRHGYLGERYFLVHLSHVLSRLGKIAVYLYSAFTGKRTIRIFGAHGSFIIFTEKATRKLYPFFNDKMFLYNEETYLAYKAKKMNVPVVYCRDIIVNHLEGASCSGDFSKQFPFYKESFQILDKLRQNKEL